MGNFVSTWQPPTRELIIFGCYFLIAGIWLTAFGAHITTQGDDWQMIASSHLGFYPACTGLQNWIVPYRPLHPFLHCIAYQVYGLDTSKYYAISALLYGGVAFMWYRVSKRLFYLHDWAAVLAGIIWLAFPDDLARQHLIGGFRLAGPLLSLIGMEVIVRARNMRHHARAVLIGCAITLVGFLIYESLIGMWVGLLSIHFVNQIWLLTSEIRDGADFKVERLSSVRTLLAVYLVLATFTLWRTALVPLTYTSETFVEGQHSFFNDWDYKLLQLKVTPLLPTTNTIRSMYMTADALPASSTNELTAMRIAAILCGLLALMALVYPGEESRPRRHLIGIGLLALPLGALPYYLTELDFTSEVFRSLNIPFGVSLIVIGMLFLLPRKTWKVVGAAGAICLVVYTSSAEALQAKAYGEESKRLCSVLEQLASALPSFEGGMILVEGWQNTDAYQLSSLASAIWGTPGQTKWSLGVNGAHGYHLSGVEKVEIKGGLIHWEGLPPLALFKKSGFVYNPLPAEVPVVVFRVEGERVSLIYSSFDYKDGIAHERVKEMCR